MKFLWSLALFAAAASAQSTTDSGAAAPSASGKCEAEYIVKRCLETENAKVEDCKANDWDCLCASYEAVATCFNNCPDDPRASSAQSQVKINCQQASLYGTATKATKTSSHTATAASSDATATDSDAADATASATESAASAENTNNAADKARNTAGVLLAVAGVVAAIL
ncbi:phospholipase d1 protein [Fusarium austroafricanum]|uniref:Phospholipase d1 protein n=1 Tax=Fusarium austroafricanum TaxID=2364996 RepID=A0A8H4NWB6_9HYPO|nr:phospholipase d1 protein [Fusarium austroafricanum]